MKQTQLTQFLNNTAIGRDIEALAAHLAKTGAFKFDYAPGYKGDLTPLFYDQGVTMVADKNEIALALVTFLKKHCYHGNLVVLAQEYAEHKAEKLAACKWTYSYGVLAFVLDRLQYRVYFGRGGLRKVNHRAYSHSPY